MPKKAEWYRRTEGKLYGYPAIETAIIHLQAQIKLLKGILVPPRAQTYDRIGPPSTGPRLTEPEGYVEDRAAKIGRLEDKIAVKEAEKKAIDTALSRLNTEERELVKKWYFQSWKHTRLDKRIWRELMISRTEFYERKKEILIKVAAALGELIDCQV